ELGADDYIAKPFGVREVAARVRAVTRRALAQRRTERTPEAWRLGRWTVSPDALQARDGTTTVDLSLREVRLLEEFYRNPGRALDRAHLFRTCWGLDFLPNSRTLDQHIARLRKRLERDPRQPDLLKTVHGVGYRYDGEDEDG
ncbi:MAG: winged helix-turn-helix domain-containing protein, partial [Planctomycetota bacterium]